MLVRHPHSHGLTHTEDIVEAVCHLLRMNKEIARALVAPEVWHRVRRELVGIRDPGLGFEAGRMYWHIAGVKLWLDVDVSFPSGGEEIGIECQ